MRRSPRRPLILKRRKLPFQQNDLTAKDGAQSHQAAVSDLGESSTSQRFPDGICVLNHPSMSDTQVVVIPKNADLQSVIGALTARGKECGPQGPNKFILLSQSTGSDNGSLCHPSAEGSDISTLRIDEQCVKVETDANFHDGKPLTGIKPFNKELECGPLDDSLTNMQWLGQMNTCTTEPEPTDETIDKENQEPDVKPVKGGPVSAVNKDFFQDFENGNSYTQDAPADAVSNPLSERPPYSYMAMIQFAINSSKNGKMTLKEIYTWIEDHFPYFRDVAKPGWKNSIRHNLSLHDMFIRETTADGKISFWTIRPEANRCLTLDQVYKPGCDPMTTPVPVPMFLLPSQQHKKLLPDARRIPTGTERRIKPLLPRTDSYLVPIQLPVNSSVYPPSSSAPNPPSVSLKKRNISREAKRVRIAPKVTKCDVPVVIAYSEKSNEVKMEIKEEPVPIPIKCESPKSIPGRRASSSRRKQRLTRSVHEEPVLLCPDNTFFDSGLASDVSTFNDKTLPDAEVYDRWHEQHSPDRECSFKTPIKGSSQLTSSTPSKLLPNVAVEPWKVTPMGKGSILDFSPIRTPGGPAVTPHHDYTTFSFSGTPFKDWPLFNSPRELLNPATPRRTPGPSVQATPTNRSLTEGLVLDTMNDSLSKILVDISFSGLDDEDLGMANISWSEFMPTLK